MFMKMNTKGRTQFFLFSIVFFNFFVFCQRGSVVLVDDSSDPNIKITNFPVTDKPTTVENYPGCQTWSNWVCQQCLDGYYLDNKQICRQVDPNCHQFNMQAVICEECYQGYFINDGKCTKIK
jgi:hypothetical protein